MAGTSDCQEKSDRLHIWFLDTWMVTVPSSGRMAFLAFDSKIGFIAPRSAHAPFTPFGNSQTRSLSMRRAQTRTSPKGASTSKTRVTPGFTSGR